MNTHHLLHVLLPIFLAMTVSQCCPDETQGKAEDQIPCPVADLPLKLNRTLVNQNQIPEVLLRDFKFSERYKGHPGVKVCPCDETLVAVDTTILNPEEKTQVASGETKPNSNGQFWIPFDAHEPFDNGYLSPSRKKTLANVPVGQKVKIAILDTGLADSLVQNFDSQIARTLNLFDFGPEVKDSIGHGSVVWSIIEGIATQMAEYYIYKCIDNQGNGSAFTVACALKCAQQDDVDVINISLGSYEDVEIVRDIIVNDLQEPVIFASEGNERILVDQFPHYPSDYPGVQAICGRRDNCYHGQDVEASFWQCTNGTPVRPNLAAPAMISSLTGSVRYGTSFSTAYFTGTYALHLYNYWTESPAPPKEVLQSHFLPNQIQTQWRYLRAADKCVRMRSLKSSVP